jgi:TPR repeat protein
MDALRAAANAGDARAMSDLGATYAVGGEDVEQSWSEAFRWFTAASEAGSALATMNLAGCYREGNGCAKDEARAVACYRAVAEDAANPEPDAMEVLGEIYSDGACGVERDLAEAARWFTRGAAAGSVECSYRRGVCLATGAGLALDYPAAVAAFTAAANAGHAGAALDLGHCLMNGLGAAPDADLAAKRYRVAADAGSPEAAYHLAMAHVAGRLGARSSERAAVRWLERAAEEGHVEAMGELGRVLAGGEGGGNARGNNTPSGRPPKSEATLDRDRARAVEWYRRAAALGHAESAAALGSACFSGVGEVVRADLDEAERWFVRAAELGMEEARAAAADVATERDARAKRAEALDAHDRLWAAFEEKLERRRRGSAAEESEGEGKGPGAKKKNCRRRAERVGASADVCRRGARPGGRDDGRARARGGRAGARRGVEEAVGRVRGEARERVRPGRGGGGRAARGGGLRAVPETE